MDLKSIISSTSITDKSENQDFHGNFEGKNINSVSVADGLGTYKYASLASEKTIEFFIKQAKELDSNEKFIEPNFYDYFRGLFKQAKSELVNFSKDFLKDKVVTESELFGTTALTVIETEGKIVIAYVGNGAIWHIRGCYSDFVSPYLFPWNAINLLNPHSLPQDGKEALYRIISDNKGNDEENRECIPTIIELSKDEEFGDIILICTDGISSFDQIKAGQNLKGIYLKYEPAILKFYEYLSLYFKNSESFTKDNLTPILNKYLEELKPELNDDATIGVLITKDAIKYQLNISRL